MGIFRHVLRLYGGKILENAQQRLVLGKSVYEIDAGLPPAEPQRAVDHVEIGVHVQYPVENFLVF